MKHWIPALMLVCAAAANTQATAQIETDAAPNPCGSLQNPAYGPFDYRTATIEQKALVEKNHFTPGVEMLQVRKTGPFGHDIGYTLRVFPNHPRALAAMQRLAEREKRDTPEGAPFSVECFYERALRFQSTDHGVRLLYANYLAGRGEFDAASRHLKYVDETQADNPFAIYNIGLIYFDMKNYDQALAHAQKALGMGLTRTELKKRLEQVNQWADPVPEPASGASAPATAASAASSAR